jgi:hypothetical protein
MRTAANDVDIVIIYISACAKSKVDFAVSTCTHDLYAQIRAYLFEMITFTHLYARPVRTDSCVFVRNDHFHAPVRTTCTLDK